MTHFSITFSKLPILQKRSYTTLIAGAAFVFYADITFGFLLFPFDLSIKYFQIRNALAGTYAGFAKIINLNRVNK
jgi:hypothetical protein